MIPIWAQHVLVTLVTIASTLAAVIAREHVQTRRVNREVRAILAARLERREREQRERDEGDDQ